MSKSQTKRLSKGQRTHRRRTDAGLIRTDSGRLLRGQPKQKHTWVCVRLRKDGQRRWVGYPTNAYVKNEIPCEAQNTGSICHVCGASRP